MPATRSRLFGIVVGVLALYLVSCSAIGIVVAEKALHPNRSALSATDETEGRAWARDNDDATLSDVTIKANDGVMLSAWEVEPDEANGNAVILLHGLRGNRLEMVNYADMLLNRGYRVLMPDARAHGDSGGKIATYGFLERDDIRSWFIWLQTTRHPRCIYGFGESMGAAQMLQALQVEPRFCAVAVECPFSTLKESFYDRIGQRFHTGPWLGRTILRPVVTSASIYLRFRYHINLSAISPEAAVTATEVPVLLIHGQTDANIPVRHSEHIQADNPEDVVLWEIPNTGHSNAIDTSPQELERRLLTWFRMHPDKPERSGQTHSLLETARTHS